MIRCGLKKICLVIIIFTLTSCSTIQVVKVDKNIKRIDLFNSKGEFIKSYYKKFDNETDQWLLANCKKNIKCEFTNVSLSIINNAKDSASNLVSLISGKNKTNAAQEEQGKEQQNSEEQDQENQEEEEPIPLNPPSE